MNKGWMKNQRAFLNKIEKKVKKVFEIFDEERCGRIDVREVGTVLRSLGCCPSEADIQEVLAEVEQPSGYVSLDRFLPLATQILVDRRYAPATKDQLLQAFETLDEEKHGYLTTEQLEASLTEEGEPFTYDEIEEMLSVALDRERNVIPYKAFVNHMVLEEKW